MIQSRVSNLSIAPEANFRHLGISVFFAGWASTAISLRFPPCFAHMVVLPYKGNPP
jgi:hypothetical protein